MRVLALDVPRILDEDTIIHPKPLKANFGENVNAQIEESKRGSSKPIDAFHNMKTVTWRERVAGNGCHVDLLVILQRSTNEGQSSVEVD
jgi:hypothetical protein